MSWDEMMQENEELRTENADLQRELAEANDYIEHYEDQFR
jgi:regulator of replication initiation timing